MEEFMRTVSSLAALTALTFAVGALCPGLALAADAPHKAGQAVKADKVDEASPAKASGSAHKKHIAKGKAAPAAKAAKAAAPDKSDKDVAKKGEKPSKKAHPALAPLPKDSIVTTVSVKTSGKKHHETKTEIVLASAKTPAHASKVDRHADEKSRAKGGNHAEIHVQHQVRDTLGRRHADTHGEPSKQDLERIAADTHRAEEQKLLSKVRFNKENGVDFKKASAKTEPAAKADKTDLLKGGKKVVPTCSKPAVDFVRGDHTESIRLVTCEGNVLPTAVKSLTELVKPPVGTPHGPGSDKSIEPRLIGRLETIAEHFSKSHQIQGPGKSKKLVAEPARIEIVSGYRPYSKGSYHAHARAVDIRVKGVSNEELLAFCKTMEDTGCGYYPNSTFVHVDARDVGAGHVSWIDASGPGETPRYVSAWPPPAEEDAKATEPTQNKVVEDQSPKGDKKNDEALPAPAPAADADKAKSEKTDKPEG